MTQDTQKKDYQWHPVTPDYLLSNHSFFRLKGMVPVLIWIVIVALSLLGVSLILSYGLTEIDHRYTELINFFLLNPAFIIGLLLFFWFGFEWGFVPLFLSSFLIAFYSEMDVWWALLIGLSFVLGMAIFALAYQSMGVPYNLRKVQSVAFFVGIAFVSAVASSLGSFIWSFYHQISASDALILWQSWWSGLFFQSVLIVAPILYFFSRDIERFKRNFITLPPKKEVSSSWVYGSVITVTVTLIIFVYSAYMLGKLGVEEALAGEEFTSAAMLEALEAFEIISWTSIGIIVITGFAAMYLMSIWNKRLNIEVDRQTLQLSKNQQQLQKLLEEKEVLLKEVHHRVKNNLAQIYALLELQEYSDKEYDTKDLFRISKSRVRSMALAHEALYKNEDFSNINLKDYFHEICEATHNSFKPTDKNIEIDYELSVIQMDMTKAIPLGLILNELLINSYQHAFLNKDEGVIKVESEKMEDKLNLVIEDNGIGMQKDEKEADKKSFGMILINGLIDQLSGSIDINTSEQGTTYHIHIPVDAKTGKI